ncbi:MAG TPA: hydroxyethylthiazole kinase [Limnochordales bacterium]
MTVSKELGRRAARALEAIRAQRPLVHHITNFVVMNDTANVTLQVGALPVMAHAREEVGEMVAMAGALVLNIGTLTPDWVESMLAAGRRANELGVPVVLDPVGAGATTLRTESARRLLATLRVRVVRGNAGEIGALYGTGGVVKGVESMGGVEDPLRLAQEAARAWGTVVAITGKRDIVADGRRALGVDNGHPYLTTLTGTGCMSTTMVAAFAAVEPDGLVAAAAGLACFGLAAERAAEQARGPGSFKAALLDALYHLQPADLEQGARIGVLAGDL